MPKRTRQLPLSSDAHLSFYPLTSPSPQPPGADGMPQPDLLSTLPGPPLRNSRHWMIRNTQDQWARNQEHNKKTGRPVVPLGMLVRPWATQYGVAGFSPKEWPPGSAKKVTDKKKCAAAPAVKARPPAAAARAGSAVRPRVAPHNSTAFN